MSSTVLIIDDEDLVRETTKTMLTMVGFQVMTATDGLEALRIYPDFSAEIDVVLLDVTMPTLSGLETLRRLLEINPAQKVIMASGDIDEEENEFLALGARGSILKPFRLKKLIDSINAVIES